MLGRQQLGTNCTAPARAPIVLEPGPLYSLHPFRPSSLPPSVHFPKQYEAITKSGITIDERVPIPPELVPKDAGVEIAAKVRRRTGREGGKRKEG